MMQIINVKQNPQYKDQAIQYFQQQWATEHSMKVYEDCITHAISTESVLPIWYLLVDADKIVGCAGVITNDFISRMDLWPWICALYIEPAYRGKRLSEKLINQAKADTRKAGFQTIHLCTDHIGLYEKYGFDYIGDGYHPWGESSRIYQCSL